MAMQAYNDIIVWYQTEGDKRTAIASTLRDANDDPVDLSSHTVAFLMTLASTDAVVIDNEAATVDDADAGQVSYSPSDTFAALADADYWGWWIVTRTSDGKVDHYPVDGKRFKIVIVPKYVAA